MPQGWTPVAEPPAAPAGWTPVAEANFHATNEPPSPSMWDRANTPLIPQIADAAHAIADHLDAPAQHRSQTEAQIRGFLAGATGAAGDVAASFTSPVGIALTLSGLSGESGVAKSVPALKALLDLPAVRTLQKAVQAGAGSAFAGEGASRIVNAPTVGGKLAGAAELATGAVGMAPAATAAVEGARPVLTSPLARKAAAGVIKHGATAGGAYLAGAPGAIVGSTIGEEIASAIRPKAAPPSAPSNVSPPGVDRYMPNVSGVSAAPAPVAVSPAAVPVVEAPAVGPRAMDGGPAGATKSPQQLLNEEAIARRRAAYQASQAATPPAAAPIVAASGKMQLTAAEMQEFTRLQRRGLSLEDALAAVRNMRALNAQIGGATPAEVAQDMAQRRYKS